MSTYNPPNPPLGPTNLLIGGTTPYWHSRGFMPHFENPDAIQHVTFHLADSLPAHVVRQLQAELQLLPENEQHTERARRIQAWADAGYGCCILRHPEIARMVQSALFCFDGVRYKILAWVIMPNHVHVLFQAIGSWTMAKIVASWKKFTARKICDHYRDNHPGEIPPQPVWHREYWDRYVRNERHLALVIRYIHMNPVKAGLVAGAEDWEWSSAYCGRGAG